MRSTSKILAAASGSIVGSLCATTAFANPTFTVSPNSGALPSYTTAQVFETFDTGYSPTRTPAKTGTVTTGGSFTETSTVSALFQAKLNPDDTASSRALELNTGGDYRVVFSNPQQFLSFEYSAPGGDDLDLTLRTADGSIFDQPFAFQYYNSNLSGRVNFDLGGSSGLLQLDIKSVYGVILLDNIAAAVPEPGTWGMMILGFGAIGYVMRRHRRARTTLSFA